MKTFIYPTYNDLSRAAADFVTDYIQQHPAALLCFPSGETPTGLLQYLVQYVQTGKVDFSRCRFVGLDEWVGLSPHDEGSCQHYMYTHFFDPAGIKPDQSQFFDTLVPDLAAECRRIDDYIFKNGPIDLMLVGVGLNGHLGLNEPGVAFDLYSHLQTLDDTTKTVGQKYFKQPTALQEGITLGLQHLMDAKTAVLMAAGTKKAAIVAQALQGEVTNRVPASILQDHANAYIFLDHEAAAALKTSADA